MAFECKGPDHTSYIYSRSVIVKNILAASLLSFSISPGETHMDYKSAIAAACNGKAILFVGAGFSVGAVSISGEALPTGRELAKALCIDAGVPISDDLKQASGRYLKKVDPDTLVEKLRNTFTIRSVTPSQKIISALPWKATYTTNYDNILERGAADSGKLSSPVTLDKDPRHFKKSENSVLHINGFVDSLTTQALNTSFKLTNTSYLTEQFRNSIWSEVFIRHTQSAQAIFFVGYSLYDLDIQEILFADSRLKEKTFFIQRADSDAAEMMYSELNDFGTILPIGIDQFAHDISAIDPLSISSDNTLLISCFDEIKYDASVISVVKDEDVFGLLLKGELNRKYILDQYLGSQRPQDNQYMFLRQAKTQLDTVILNQKNIVIHADLGNGKTCLLNAAVAQLIATGFRVFWLRDEAYDCLDDIEQLFNLREPVALIFDNYTRKIELIAHANLKRKSDSVFLMSARSMDHELCEEQLYYSRVRLDPKTTFELDVNKLEDADVSELSGFLEKHGLWGERASQHADKKSRYIKYKCNAELHGVLLGILQSPDIQRRFHELFTTTKSSAEHSRTIIAAFVLNMLNITAPTPHMIAALAGDNAIFSPHFKSNKAVRQLFNSAIGAITPKSSVLAEFSLQNFPDAVLLVETLVDICRSARNKADANTFYWDIYCDLASFRNIQRMLPQSGKRESLIRFYDGLRTIDVERSNPHFWLQYAIARLSYPDETNLEQAKNYLDTALSLGRKRQNYTTTDIETQLARYYLQSAIEIITDVGIAMANFKNAHLLIANITRVEKNKKEAFRPVRLYESFYLKFERQLTKEHRVMIENYCDDLLCNIEKLPPRTAEDQTVVMATKGLRATLLKISLARAITE